MTPRGFTIRIADPHADADAWGRMRLALWPDEGAVDAAESLLDALEPAAGSCVMLAFDADGAAVGFAEAKLRHDYVNGTGSSPVAFLEAWFVATEARGRGVGRALIAGVEAWARTCGCSEFASDALLDNSGSHAAHLGCGFQETERVVYYRKALAP